MKDIKLMLKDAKEAIKSKNYEASLNLCKLILEEDGNNYMALVFLGVSLLQTGQHTKALNAFQDAIKTNSSNALAWNGLINYYEKVDTKESKRGLTKAYMSLLNIENNEKKLIEFVKKLRDFCEYGNVTDVVLAIYSLFKSGKCTDIIEIATSLVDILSRNKDLPSNLMLIYEEVLNIVLNNQKTVCLKYFSDYLNLLYKLNRKEEAYNLAKKMYAMFPLDCISLEWLCKIFNESYVELNVMTEKIEDVTKYSNDLLKLEPQSATALFTQSILLMEHNKSIEAKDLLCQIVNSSPGLLHSWMLLSKICLKLELYDEAFQAAEKADKLLQSNHESQQKLKDDVAKLIIEGLSRSNEEKDLKRVLQLCEKVSEEIKSASICHIIRANIGLKNFTQAKLLLDNFQQICGCEIMHKLLSAQLLYKQEKYEEAIQLLENENVEMSEWWLQLGILYWKSGLYDKSLIAYLKATKLDYNNYKCFLLLGDYYKKANDLDKARRCYEKSFKLNTRCSEAGIELSEIYRKMKNWDANLLLLQALTRGVINKANSWAWMQLGLHYLEQQNYDDAIINLRLVVRVDENNLNCWESLADAYLAKGAFSSALKCYEKAIFISEDSLYPLIQMATIKKILGDFIEARSNFEKVLKFDKLYIPALKGMAETCLLQAKNALKDQRLGTCRDHAQYASDHLIIALKQHDGLACLWKLLGDICLIVANLPEKFSCLLVLSSFLENTEVTGNTVLEKNDLFTLAAKCYYKNVGLNEDMLMWHDLAVCYLLHSRNTENKEIFEESIKKAQIIADYCTLKNPKYWQLWNLLGNISMISIPPNYKQAQHSFIKAVTADNNSAVSWCNLGTLYFILRDYKLANEAYSQAQRADPNYVNSWIGQALLAEGLAHEDAMDLFRHSTQLAFHKQGALGYGHWVCKTLKESPLNVVTYAIHNMNAISVACDVITWYSEHNPVDGTAWNILGILKERMSLKLGALEAFKNALNLSKGKYRDLARVNYGRLLVLLDRHSQAIDVFTEIETATFNSGSGLALALFKSKRYKESYEVYESTLHWLSEEPNSQSELLVALASMAYMFDGPEAAKTLLFQSIQLQQPSPWSFYATLALGLLHRDFNFSILILTELEKFKLKENCAQHIAVLSGLFFLLQGSNKTAIRELSKVIYRYPNEAPVWFNLSSVLIRLCKDQPSLNAAAKCAQIAMKLGQSNMDVTQVLCLVSLSCLVIGNKRDALCMAQKAIHCYPNLAESWTVFGAALSDTKILTDSHIKNILKFAISLGNNEVLKNWIQKKICLF